MSGLADIADLVVDQIQADDRTLPFRVDYALYDHIGRGDAASVQPVVHNGVSTFNVCFYSGHHDPPGTAVSFDDAEEVAAILIATAKSNDQDGLSLSIVPRDVEGAVGPYCYSGREVKTLYAKFRGSRDATEANCIDVIASMLRLCERMRPVCGA